MGCYYLFRLREDSTLIPLGCRVKAGRIEDAYKELKKWVRKNKGVFLILHIWHEDGGHYPKKREWCIFIYNNGLPNNPWKFSRVVTPKDLNLAKKALELSENKPYKPIPSQQKFT